MYGKRTIDGEKIIFLWVMQGFEPKRPPTEGRKRHQGWCRKGTEAGRREQTGCLRPEAESLRAQNSLRAPRNGSIMAV